MNDRNFIKRFFNRLGFTRSKPETPKEGRGIESTAPSSRQVDIMRRIAQMVAQTDELELACDDVFVLLDVCAELAKRGEQVPEKLQLVKRHLEMCPDCREEYEALLRILDAPSLKA